MTVNGNRLTSGAPTNREPAPNRSPPRWQARALISLSVWLAICFGAALLGGLFTAGATEPADGWYATLQKPSWNPPRWVFGPVWSMLYAMMAVSAWLVWRRPASSARRAAMIAFSVQLVFNVAWSALFFGLERPDLAALEIVVLWVAIATTAHLFRRLSPLAGWLLVPYLAWVAFAAVLNVAIWNLNPT